MQRDTERRQRMLRSLCLCVSVVSVVLLLSCSRPPHDAPDATAVYNKDGVLEQIQVDRDRNGVLDTWSYMNGSRIVRIEIDRDEDGKVERWEYYGADEALEKVGYSRAGDGKVDAWAWQGPDGKVARVEEDTNADGLVDQWKRYRAGRLSSVEFDTTRDGQPDNRLVYEPDGTVRVEAVKR
jgi:hypothetical protein